MAVATKRRTKVGVTVPANEERSANRGGDKNLAIEEGSAAQIQQPGESVVDTDEGPSGLVADKDTSANGTAIVSRESRNGHADKAVKPLDGSRDVPCGNERSIDTDSARAAAESNGGGDTRGEHDASSAPTKSKGRANRSLKSNGGMHDNAGGENRGESDTETAASKSKRRSSAGAKPIGTLNGEAAGGVATSDTEHPAATCRSLQELERRRASVIKSRVRIGNEVTANVAIVLGYHAGLEEAERKNLWDTAGKIVTAIQKGKELAPDLQPIADKVFGLVAGVTEASDHFDRYQAGIDKEMLALADTLPVIEWAKGIRGFGPLRLAVIVGETGDLSQYSNPGKVWKRLGLAPIQKGGVTKMPSTWRSKGGLSAEEWTTAGYSPRRRAIASVSGELLVKLNDGIYRARYDEAKAKFAAADPERTKGHCHNHAMLCCVKRLVRDLWVEWNKRESGSSPVATCRS
jgi:hypothetical protein